MKGNPNSHRNHPLAAVFADLEVCSLVTKVGSKESPCKQPPCYLAGLLRTNQDQNLEYLTEPCSSFCARFIAATAAVGLLYWCTSQDGLVLWGKAYTT